MTDPMAHGSDRGVPLVIGVGNESRGDDAAGLRVTRELRPRVGNRVRLVECPGEITELLDLWEGREEVFLVDAVRSGHAPGTWRRIMVGSEPLPSSLASTSTHGLSIASAVALGQALGRMPAHLVVYGIEASRFDPGAEVSPEVLLGIQQVTRALAEELERDTPAVGAPANE
jgi:hydrogenase maturation protease